MEGEAVGDAGGDGRVTGEPAEVGGKQPDLRSTTRVRLLNYATTTDEAAEAGRESQH